MSFVLVLFLTLASLAQDDRTVEEEISLFSASGEPEAYIDVAGQLTVYLWGGKPVAYLDDDSDGGFHLYGFNGKHLGWFLRGAVWDHKGKAACATKELMRSAKPERFKSFKQFRPFKAFKQFAPPQPVLSPEFGEESCQLLLASGAAG